MTATTLIHMNQALAWEGFDVDVIPYGQAVTYDDLADAELVVVLPVIDYPNSDGDLTLYDEEWSVEEIEVLTTYVDEGGLLVLTNSDNRLMFGMVFDANEDWRDVNALSEHFGVVYEAGTFPSTRAQLQMEHPLMQQQYILTLIENNGIPFTMETGEMLAEVDGTPVVGLVDYGDSGGQVLALADVGLLDFVGFGPQERRNFDFLLNLAHYAAQSPRP